MVDVGRLRAAKLQGLVRVHTGEELIGQQAPGIAGGLLASGAGYFYAAGDEPIRMLGPAMIWADRVKATELNLLADTDAGHLARRAGLFQGPLRCNVFQVVDTELVAAEPAPHLALPTLGDDEWAFGGLISDTGARPVDDHGRLVAEVAGLEIARVTRGDEGADIDVGVGQADRELHGLVHYQMDPDTAIRRARTAVLEHRRPGAPMHPLNRMARERWLRSLLLDTPSLVGAEDLVALPPLRPRETVLGNVPSAAAGRTPEGEPIVVVCSVGVDPDLIPEAADYRDRHDPAATLVVIVPERDRYAVTEKLAAKLPNCSLRSIPVPWA